MDSTIQGLWIGGELSALELLSIRSFLANGHKYDLYGYKKPPNLPAGAAFCDAAEILPESSVFQYRDHASYAGFANWFRYRLLLLKGGWWADTDIVCLRPFLFTDPHVFSSEPDGLAHTITNAVIKAPRDSEIMRHAADVCASKDPSTLVWGETGPSLLSSAVKEFGYHDRVAVPGVFCPLPFREWQRALTVDEAITLPHDCHAIHLWNEMWRRNGCDKNSVYPPDCLFEKLKAQFGVS